VIIPLSGGRAVSRQKITPPDFKQSRNLGGVFNVRELNCNKTSSKGTHCTLSRYDDNNGKGIEDKTRRQSLRDYKGTFGT